MNHKPEVGARELSARVRREARRLRAEARLHRRTAVAANRNIANTTADFAFAAAYAEVALRLERMVRK